MSVEMPHEDMDLSSIPADFRHNCKFLCQLIECKDKNDLVISPLQELLHGRADKKPTELNKRQKTILKKILEGLERQDIECFDPPVPAELEASIRVKPRRCRLPWEAEAIRKIDLWRKDVRHMVERLSPGRVTELINQPPFGSPCG
jgi:hypothetical protein